MVRRRGGRGLARVAWACGSTLETGSALTAGSEAAGSTGTALSEPALSEAAGSTGTALSEPAGSTGAAALPVAVVVHLPSATSAAVAVVVAVAVMATAAADARADDEAAEEDDGDDEDRAGDDAYPGGDRVESAAPSGPRVVVVRLVTTGVVVVSMGPVTGSGVAVVSLMPSMIGAMLMRRS